MRYAILLLTLSGCYSSVGPIVTSVHEVGGHLYFTRCTLEAGIAGARVTACVDERGKPEGYQDSTPKQEEWTLGR